MSDDPASIEAWQQQMSDDIVTRLRGHISITSRIHYAKDGYPEPVYVHGPSPICQEAADEIERLRKKLLAEENAYDILRLENEHLQTDRNNLALSLNLERDEGVVDIERLRKERDEARREACGTDGGTIGEAMLEARQRGWDCFDRTPNDIEAHEIRGDLAGGT